MMVRPILLALLGVLAVLWTPEVAEACSMRHVGVFEQADQAAVIAVGQRLRGKGIRASEVLVGTARRGVVEIEVDPRSTCAPAMTRGVNALVFVDAQHRFVAHYQSWIAADPVLLQALRRYVGAADADARRAVLVELATSTTGQLAADAAFHLARRPDLLRGATEVERGQLIAMLSEAEGLHLQGLAWVVARLHDAAAVPVLIAVIDRLGPTSYVEEIAIPLELLTNHLQPLDDTSHPGSEGERFYTWRRLLDLRQVGAEIAGGAVQSPEHVTHAHWSRWLARNRSLDGDDFYRRGFEERGAPVPADDPQALGRTIRGASDGVTRLVAMDRCEQHWGRALMDFPSYARGAPPYLWPILATACETGVPVH